MSISAVCVCNAQIEAPDDLAGQSVSCPQCRAAVSIPSLGGGAKASTRAENYREHGQVGADLKEKALAELGPNEKVVWIGQPVAALVLRRNLGYFVLGGVVALVSVLWLLGAFAQKQVSKPPVAGKAGKAAAPQAKAPPPATETGSLPLIFLAGSACCLLPPFFRWRSAQHTCYALTNRRALVYKEGLFGPTQESYSPVEVAQMRRSNSWVFQDGGDLIFKSVTVVSTSYHQRTGRSTSTKTTHYGFLAIAHVKEVEKLVRETLIDRFVDKLQEANAL